MNAVKSVALETPAGPCELRWTAGASRRLRERFGSIEAIDDGDPANLVEACWYLMFDENGEPPKGLTLNRWLEVCPMDADTIKEFAGSLGAAMSGKEKNEVRAIVEQAIENQTGSDSTPSPTLVSDSADKSSGGVTPSTSSTNSPRSGKKGKTSRITAPVSLQQQP